MELGPPEQYAQCTHGLYRTAQLPGTNLATVDMLVTFLCTLQILIQSNQPVGWPVV